MRRNIMKSVVGLLVAASMVATSCPVTAETKETAPEKVEVFVSAQAENNFILAPQSITVSEDASEKYGFTDLGEGKVSFLDVMITMNELTFGEEFEQSPEEFLSVSEYGYITLAFGMDASTLMFSVNGITPNDGVIGAYGTYTGYTADQAEVQDGDDCGVYFIQDTSYWSDNYTWFETESDEFYAGEEYEFVLKGYSLVYYGCSPKEDIDSATTDIKSAQLALCDENGLLTDLGVVTDENGKANVLFTEAGTYTLAAYIESDSSSSLLTPIFMPIKTIIVKDKEAETSSDTEASTEATTTSETEKTTEAATTTKETTTEKTTVKKNKVGAVKIVKAKKKRKAKKATIRLSKVKNATGYQVKITVKKSVKGKYVANKMSKKNIFTFAKIKPGKKYYVFARAYKKVGKKKIFGAWTKAKKIV